MKKYYFLFLLTISACTKFESTSIDVGEIEKLDKQMVASSILLDTDSILYTHFSKTENFYQIDTNFIGFPEILDVEGRVKINDQEIGSYNYIPKADRFKRFLYKNYKIELPKRLSSGDEISLSASHPDLGVVTATEQMPSKIPINKVEFIASAGTSDLGHPLSGIKITFQDIPTEENFFRIELRYQLDVPIPLSNLKGDTITFELIGINTNDPNFKYDGNWPPAWPWHFYMNDKVFDGQTFSITILFEEKYASNELTLAWYNISKGWFNYYGLASRNRPKSGLLGAFIELEEIPDNIDGGYGFFAAGTLELVPVKK